MEVGSSPLCISSQHAFKVAYGQKQHGCEGDEGEGGHGFSDNPDHGIPLDVSCYSQ